MSKINISITNSELEDALSLSNTTNTKKDLKSEMKHLIKQCDIVHMFLIEQCDMLDTDMEFAIGDISTLLRLINKKI
tara:strand:- start:15029 stop:15259 length:231 start_codon:yes stop_codon:yes gene_type:complete